MKNKITKISAIVLFVLQFSFAAMYAQNPEKMDELKFADSLQKVIIAATDSFRSITGKEHFGLEGTLDVPYKTYDSKVQVPGALLTYIMSNNDYTSVDKHINTFVCKYSMSPDKASAMKFFKELCSGINYSLKVRTMHYTRCDTGHEDGTMVQKKSNYRVAKSIPNNNGEVVMVVTIEKMTNAKKAGKGPYAVYLRINKE